MLITIGLPVLALGLREMTRLVFARTVSPVPVEPDSYLPFRLRLDFHQTPSIFTPRLVGLAPSLIESATVMVAVQRGFWQRIRNVGSYYFAGINRLLYAAPSPADLRVAISPPTEQPDRQASAQ